MANVSANVRSGVMSMWAAVSIIVILGAGLLASLAAIVIATVA